MFAIAATIITAIAYKTSAGKSKVVVFEHVLPERTLLVETLKLKKPQFPKHLSV